MLPMEWGELHGGDRLTSMRGLTQDEAQRDSQIRKRLAAICG